MPGNKMQDGAQAFVQLKVRAKDGEVKDLNVMPNHLVNFQFIEQKGSVGVCNINLFDPSFSDLEDVIFSSRILTTDDRKSPAVNAGLIVKWGWNPGPISREWKLHVTSYKSRFTAGTGTELELSCVAFPELIQKTLSETIKAGTPATIAIKAIAKKLGYQADVEEGIIPRDVRAKNENAWAFLKKLTKKTLSRRTNKATYRVWLRPNTSPPTIVFRTDNTNPAKREWQYLFARDADSSLLEYEANIESNLLWGLGSAGVVARIVDKSKKSSSTLFFNQSTIPGAVSSGSFIPQSTSFPSPLRLGFDSKKEAQAYAEARFHRLSLSNTSALAKVVGNPEITVEDIITVLLTAGMGKVEGIDTIHPTSGSYNILKLTHSVSGTGEYTTEIEGYRRGNEAIGVGGDLEVRGSQAALDNIKRARKLNENIIYPSTFRLRRRAGE